ncbi:MAG: ribonuclease Y, partial [Minisyncoccia bacterium]
TGIILGYYVRQSLVKKKKGTIEAKLEKKIQQTKEEAERILKEAQQKADQIITKAQEEFRQRREELSQTERVLLKREQTLDQKIIQQEQREREFEEKLKKIKEIKEKLEQKEIELKKRLEELARMSEKEAKDELLKQVEKEYELDIINRIQKLQKEGEEKYAQKAKELLSLAIQRYAASQSQEITTSVVNLPSEEIKGRIIGKEGRNIKVFEELTGVEVIVDDTPESVVISSFNPIRREVAKIALEKLIKDGRIQPARIEEYVQKAREEIEQKIKEYGQKAIFDTGILDLPEGIINLLGRLYFRTSYGQNVLLHSIEVAELSGFLASELGANVEVAKKAGLLHDIGKAIDQQIEGPHVELGIKILEKFNIPKEIIDAMKAHHEEYQAQTIEAIIVKVADQISGSRPGARKDTLENYLKRLKSLEDIALSFSGVKTAYAIQAGREIRVFVKPEEIGDLEAYKLARDIAHRIEQELNYPGEIKVTVIRETRVIEYAR